MPGGVQPWSVQPGYGTYKSPYGPKYNAPSRDRELQLTRSRYKVNLNTHGWNITNASRLYVASTTS